MRFIYTGLILLSLSVTASAQQTRKENSDLTPVLEEIQKEFGIPGIGAAVVRGDEILAGAAGVKILGKQERLTPFSRFHIGSVTKPMTATIIGTIVEQGLLKWDTQIIEVFPGWQASMNPEFKDVTLADLLSHQAGIPAFTEGEELEKLPKLPDSPVEQRRSFAEWVLKQKPIAKPKEEFAYSNAGFTIATAIAEMVTGQSWETMMQKRLFEPLQMTTAGFGWPAKNHPEEPWGHWKENGSLQPHDPNGEYQLTFFMAPAGDVHMNMPDLARFARFHLAALRGKDGILKASTVREMHTKRVKSGLGWGVQKFLDFEPVSVYAGSAETFITIIALIPQQNLAVMVSTNSDSEESDQATKKALKLLIEKFRTK